ncbi:MAG TPA: carboxypeptidase-like regulatory domain-containing protein [Thermoanaerobaculia bacterium]|jgi:hypothetical protein|nr:carboxypeptidase-like regulatory domain-containing protein [Thermoanaerobaculia bacterium]
MHNLRKSIPTLLALALLGIQGNAEAGDRHGVSGRVRGETSPLASAGVYAYQVSDLQLHKVKTDSQGEFLFEDLPAGVYQIVAHKAGFVPVMVKLHRATAEVNQFIDLQLLQAKAAAGPGKASGNDFWSLRASLPADVLRDIEIAERESFRLASFTAPEQGGIPMDGNGFQTRLEAMTGVGQTSSLGEGQVSEGRVGIEGQVGAVKVDLDGRFSQFSAAALDSGLGLTRPGTGQTSALSLRLAAGPDSRILVSSLTNRLSPNDDRTTDAVDFEHYLVRWSQGVGENGRSDFAAQYTTENNYHRHNIIDPVIIPESSRTLRVEGAFSTSLGDRSNLQTGARYRERRYVLSNATSRPEDQLVQDDLDLFGRGGFQVRPAFLVEYGLYSTLSDGSVALTPQGGIVLQLGSDWQARMSASKRAYQDTEPTPDFLPSLYGSEDLCEQVSDSCYQFLLSRQGKDDSSFSVGAVHRTVGETVRLYFSDDFFDRMESLYLVPGDRLPEVRFEVTRHLAPSVMATLQSSVASGGGGSFVASDHQPYENQVSYVVTSLDTRFQSTSTGVFVAFHHLAQSLESQDGQGHSAAQMDMERLRLQVSQDLGFLMDLATDWAVQLNMELSRGGPGTSGQQDSELRHRFLGGIAVKF